MSKQCGHDGVCQCRPGEDQQPHPFTSHPFPVPGPQSQPQWANTVGAPPARRRRLLFVAAAAFAAVVLVAATALGTIQLTDRDTADLTSVQAQTQNDGTAQPPSDTDSGTEGENDGAAPAANPDGGATTQGGSGLDEGGVFLQSNNEVANEVVAFVRKDDGRLREIGRYLTGGQGTGSFEDSAQGIVLGTADGEASPTQNIDQADLLFVTNAGSGSITVFRVLSSGLEKVSDTPSGGNRPVSLTVNSGLLYVLNSGEVDRRLILGPTTALENCGHGEPPSVTGFRVTPDGALQPIPDSTRSLSGVSRSGCAQVSFTPDGRTLVVSERIATSANQDTPNRGVITTFEVRYDGTPGQRQLNDPAGAGTFGFTFTRDGTLVTTEQNGGLANEGGGQASTYRIGRDRALTPISRSVPNQQTDSCWAVVTDDQRLVYVSSPFGGGRISSYALSPDGSLTLQHIAATSADGKDPENDSLPDGATDLGLSADSNFLYQLNSFAGTLHVFKVNPDGLLTPVEEHQVFLLEPFGTGGEAAPFGIAAR